MSAGVPANSSASRARYHHGDLGNALREAARAILEESGPAALSLRAVARRAGVSHAAPYRHFPNHELLLAELALEGFDELRCEIAVAAARPGLEEDRIAGIGGAYMRFIARRPALARLMFGPQLPRRESRPELARAADALGAEIAAAASDAARGMAIWAAAHGLAMLVLDDLLDLGQRRSGLQVAASRAEILLRSLTSRSQG